MDPNAAFYSTGPGSAKDLIKRIDDMSGGRIRIQFYGAGELVRASEGFDAVSAGTVEMNYANAYFWTGKLFAGQYFTAVPFGLNFQGFNGWMYDGGGLQLWREAYDHFNLVPFLCGNTGVQMTGWFKKPIEKVDDLKGLKMRIPGLAGRVYQSLGVDVRLLPPGEIFPALERGVIDAAEFVGPYLDRQLGLQRAAKYYYTTGWHETATGQRADRQQSQMEFTCQPDLKAIVENACAACNVISEAWCQKNNAEAMEDLIKNQGVIAQPLPRPDRGSVTRRQRQDHRRKCRQGPADQEGQQLLPGPTWKNFGSGRHTARQSTSGRNFSRADVASAERLAAGIDVFIDAVGRVTAWSSCALAAVMGGNVLLRYAFHTGTVWSQELEWHLMAPICLFGMSYALRHGEHVRVDVLFASFSPRSKDFVELVSSLLLMAISLIVIWLSISYVMQSWSIGEGSANPGGIPARYLLKSLIPIGFALMCLQAFGRCHPLYLAWRRAANAAERDPRDLDADRILCAAAGGHPGGGDARNRRLGVRLYRLRSTAVPSAAQPHLRRRHQLHPDRDAAVRLHGRDAGKIAV